LSIDKETFTNPDEKMTQILNIQTQQIPHTLRLSAAERLVSAPGRREAAKRLLESAPVHGIDLDLMWGVITPIDQSSPQKSSPRVRQVALAVLGSGRTAMVFLSHPDKPRWLGPIETQTQEISSSIKATLSGLRANAPAKVALAQTLIETEQTWAHQACTDAGMVCVGQLDYMRMPVDKQSTPLNTPPNWPEGIDVRPIRSINPNAPDSDYQNLIEALEGSYLETLDCPELCGLRTLPDVVESHSATGDFDPDRWHLIYKDGTPAGCCLLTHCPLSSSVELVYLGIAPQARGLGLGRSVLSYAINQLGQIGITEVTCAVDNRNAPAIKIYESLGFKVFDARIGFVAPIKPLL
jgi:ribosomal protein S18 acetylase RimI-like enzyme